MFTPAAFDVVDGQNTEIVGPTTPAHGVLASIVVNDRLTKSAKPSRLERQFVSLDRTDEMIAVVAKDAEPRRVATFLKIPKLIGPLAYLTTMFGSVPVDVIEGKKLELTFPAQGALEIPVAVVREGLPMEGRPEALAVQSIAPPFARDTARLKRTTFADRHEPKLSPTTSRASLHGTPRLCPR